MKNLLLTLLIPQLFGCAVAKNPVQKELTISPGELRFVEFEEPGENIRLFCKDQEIKLNRAGNKLQAVVVESYFSELKPFTCYLKQKDQNLQELVFQVVEREYKSEQLRVNPKRIKLSAKDQKRANAEQEVLNKIYASSLNSFQFNQPFMKPLDSFITSIYGTRRVYNNMKKGQHLGTDFRAAIGEKVPATNSGKVVLAADLFFTGWTVIIDHGMDIFSVYGHLSKTLVKEGDMVERGQIVALSGNTGRSSGPHLHWGVKVQGQYIDGLVLIDESQKIFKE